MSKYTKYAKKNFTEAMKEFTDAGHALVKMWDCHGFNADEEFGPCVSRDGFSLFPMSVDEWLLELQAWTEK